MPGGPTMHRLTAIAAPQLSQVDVEGYEPQVLRGAKRLLLHRRVAHAFMEYSPGVAERARDWRWLEAHPLALMG